MKPSKDKQGEQSDPITKQVADFKEGVQGVKDVKSELKKHVTIEDVLANMRADGKVV